MPMTRREIDEFLEPPRLAHFATLGTVGDPWVRPVWYVWEGGAFYFTTRQRLRRTGADARSPVAISVATEDHPYRAVVARGMAIVWERERVAWLERFARRYGTFPSWYEDAIREDDRVILRLMPEPLIAWDFGAGDYEALDASESLRAVP